MSITISVTTTKSADGAAPLLVHFDATGTISTNVSNNWRDVEYAWDFGDNTGATWDYGQHTNRNTSKGPVAAHCYLAPGTYTPSVTATDGTDSATLTLPSITVVDPSVANGWTITYVNTVGDNDFSAALPSGTGVTHQNNNSFDNSLSLYAQSSKSRVLFKGGATFTANSSGSSNIATSGTANSGIIGAYGTGKANLTVNNIPGSFGYYLFFIGSDDWRVMDLSVTNPNHYRCGVGAGSGYRKNLLLLNIDTKQCQNAWQYSDNNIPGPNAGGILHGIVNCKFQDCNAWADDGATKYIMFIAGLTKQVVLGSLFQGPQQNYNATTQQCFLNHNTRFDTHYSSVVANSKWEFGVTQVPNTSTYTSNCFWHGNTSFPASYNHIYDCIFDNGDGGGSPNVGGLTTETLNHFIFDSCFSTYAATSTSVQWCVFNAISNLTVRNCVGYTASNTGTFSGAYAITSPGGQQSDNVRFINNAFYGPNLTGVSGGNLITLTMAASGLSANNLFYCPGMAFTNVSSLTNATETNNVTKAQVTGSNPNFSNASGSFSNIADMKLTAGSYAIGLGTTSATAVSNLSDAAGVVWTTSARDLGAFQYGAAVTLHRGGKGGRGLNF